MLILDSNSDIIAYVRSNLCYLICVRHLMRPKAVTNQYFEFYFTRAQHEKVPYFRVCINIIILNFQIMYRLKNLPVYNKYD